MIYLFHFQFLQKLNLFRYCYDLNYYFVFTAVVQGRQKILRDGKEYVYQSEIRVGTGTMDYAPHLVGGVYRMRTRVQVSNSEQTLNVEVCCMIILKSRVMKQETDYYENNTTNLGQNLSFFSIIVDYRYQEE